MDPYSSGDGYRPDTGATSGARWWFHGPLRALIVVTVANYVWQVPYFLHFSAHTGRAPSGWSFRWR